MTSENSLEQEEREYFQALGQVVHRFAQAERTLCLLLNEMVTDNHWLGNVLFGELKVSSQVQAMKDIYKAKRENLPQDLSNALTQFKTVSTDRNVIVHYGSWVHHDIDGIVRSSSKSLTAKQGSSPMVINCGPRKMQDMAHDLLVISGVFQFRRKMVTKHSKEEAFRDSSELALNAQWRYTHETL